MVYMYHSFLIHLSADHTPVLFPGKFHGQRSVAGYNPRGFKELDTTESTHTHMYMCVYYFSSFFSIIGYYMLLSVAPLLYSRSFLVIYFIYQVKCQLLSCVQQFDSSWAVSCQASLLMGFSRQKCCSGQPFPSARDLIDPGSTPCLLYCRQILYSLSHQIHIVVDTARSPL